MGSLKTAAAGPSLNGRQMPSVRSEAHRGGAGSTDTTPIATLGHKQAIVVALANGRIVQPQGGN
jgi:hypothetical protein